MPRTAYLRSSHAICAAFDVSASVPLAQFCATRSPHWDSPYLANVNNENTITITGTVANACNNIYLAAQQLPAVSKHIMHVGAASLHAAQIIYRVDHHARANRDQQHIGCHAHITVTGGRRAYLHHQSRRQIVIDNVALKRSADVPFFLPDRAACSRCSFWQDREDKIRDDTPLRGSREWQRDPDRRNKRLPASSARVHGFHDHHHANPDDGVHCARDPCPCLCPPAYRPAANAAVNNSASKCPVLLKVWFMIYLPR